MVKLAGAFSSIQPFSALVLGDFMLDTYTSGRVRRVSPEAPVAVLEARQLESRPGGAGNVVLNLATLGAKVIACGRIGDDRDGHELRKRLLDHSVDVGGLIFESSYHTPVKNRFIADSQQLLRVDFETITPLPTAYEQDVLLFLQHTIPQVHVIAISDYGKGFLTPYLLEQAIALAQTFQVPLIVDPKGIDFAKYRGAYMLKPNLFEAYAAAKCSPSEPLDRVAEIIMQQTGVEFLLITRSEAGISLFSRGGLRQDFPVISKEVKDVTGAGDTVLSLMCLAIANRLPLEVAAQLANIAAGIAIERLGCVQVTLSEIARRLLEIDSETKIYDESHTYALKQVLKGKKYALLVLDASQPIDAGLFRSIRSLATPKEQDLLIYIQNADAGDALIQFLSSLQEVRFIIQQEKSLKDLCESILPHEIYLLDYRSSSPLKQPKELLRSLLEGLPYIPVPTEWHPKGLN